MQINVIEYFEKGALLTCPDKVAIVDEGRRWTFRDLERFAKNCAALILKRTEGVNRPLAVLLPKSVESVAADAGIIYSGNCYANLDVKSPPERLKSILKNLEPEFIFTSAAHMPLVHELGLSEEHLLLVEQAMSAEMHYDNPAILARLGRIIDMDPVNIVHTSGSTGSPKGVVLSHRGTIDYLDWSFDALKLDGSEVIGSLSPAFFDIYTIEMNLCLAKGATLVFVPNLYAAFPPKLVQFLFEQKISFIFWVPTMLVNIANLNLLNGTKLEALKKIIFGAEVFPTKNLNYWRRHVPWAMYANMYGPTETTVQCTYYIVDRDFADDEEIPLGFPCGNADVLVLNDEDQPATVGETGEICVRGTSLGLGYWNQPDKTDAAFVRNPLNRHYPELIYRTGDLAYRNARGELMFVGRRDFQFKHLGYRIELGEIEHACLRVNGIHNCCVEYDHSSKEIVLFYESEDELTPAVIRDRLMAFVPKYMLPTVFNRMNCLPRTENGKIDRRTLKAILT
jgi:amino acid adenylation domain-containing protein